MLNAIRTPISVISATNSTPLCMSSDTLSEPALESQPAASLVIETPAFLAVAPPPGVAEEVAATVAAARFGRRNESMACFADASTIDMPSNAATSSAGAESSAPSLSISALAMRNETATAMSEDTWESAPSVVPPLIQCPRDCPLHRSFGRTDTYHRPALPLRTLRVHNTAWSVGATVAALILHSGESPTVVCDAVTHLAAMLRRRADACDGDDTQLLRLGLATHTVRPQERHSMPAYETAGRIRRVDISACTVLSPLLLLLVRLKLMTPAMRARAGDWNWLVLHIWYAMERLLEEPLDSDLARAANEAERRAMARAVVSWRAEWWSAAAQRDAHPQPQPEPTGEIRLERDTEAIVRGYFPPNHFIDVTTHNTVMTMLNEACPKSDSHAVHISARLATT